MSASAVASDSSTTRPGVFLVGADISALTTAEQRGSVYRDVDGKSDDAIAIFRRHGWNCFRLRIFVDPDGKRGVVNSLEYTRELARRIKAAGATLILDFHYSDTWADPQHQLKPAAWKDLDFESLERRVEQYTADVLADLRQNQAMPDIVQVGNEITGGTLWPDAQVRVPESNVKFFDGDVRVIKVPEPYDDAKQWARLTRIIKAGVRAVRGAGGGANKAPRPRVMIHIDCGGDWPVTKWYFDHLAAANVDYDMIGQSFYPRWHGTMQHLADNLRETADRYHKEIVVVETAYPWKTSPGMATNRYMSWPISPDGQRRFIEELIRTVRAAPEGHGVGVIYWNPEWVAGESRDGRTWASSPMALFDDEGKPLPAMDALSRP